MNIRKSLRKMFSPERLRVEYCPGTNPSGKQGTIINTIVTKRKKGRTLARRFVSKVFHEHISQKDIVQSYYKMLLLKKLGYPTIPFPNLYKVNGRYQILMKDLGENGQKRVIDYQKVIEQREERLWLQTQYDFSRVQKKSNEYNPELEILQSMVTNPKEVQQEIEALYKKAEQQKIGLGIESFFIIKDIATKKGRVIIGDTYEIGIPNELFPPGFIQKKHLKYFKNY